MMPTVFGPTAAATPRGSRHQVLGSTSTNTGVALQNRTALAVATNVVAGTITSSPLPTPSVARARWRAVVPFEQATACRVPQAAANSRSNRVRNSPPDDTHPLRMASTT